ncbi:DUF418 domain-containing protein [Bacillus sp. C-3-6]
MNQRVEAVDAIRGFALFGILLVNMTLIQFGFFTSEKPTYLFGDLDKGANWFIQFFGTHNFISLFSFLFGLSIILLQKSIIATTIFYAYGFGLYGKIGYFFGILLTIGIYTIQLFVSTYWLQKYRMGLVEYVWRLGTYLEKPRFKRDLDKAS